MSIEGTLLLWLLLGPLFVNIFYWERREERAKNEDEATKARNAQRALGHYMQLTWVVVVVVCLIATAFKRFH